MKPTLALAALLFVFGVFSSPMHAAEPAPPAKVKQPEPAKQPDSNPPSAAKTLTLDLGNKVTLKLTTIPAGKFLMGSPKDEKDRIENEGPAREVTISKPFCMGIYPVTQEQYQAVMGKNPSHFKEPNKPVDGISWDDAVAFCKKASEKTGKKVRLPTEAEWEYASRAGSKTRYFFGDDEKDLGDYAWFRGNSNNSTHPVGQKKPNPWGLYDIYGNVAVWCSDYFDSYLKAPRKDPQGPAAGKLRVMRGGFWDYPNPLDFRSARRYWSTGGGSFYNGFRVAVSGADVD